MHTLLDFRKYSNQFIDMLADQSNYQELQKYVAEIDKSGMDSSFIELFNSLSHEKLLDNLKKISQSLTDPSLIKFLTPSNFREWFFNPTQIFSHSNNLLSRIRSSFSHEEAFKFSNSKSFEDFIDNMGPYEICSIYQRLIQLLLLGSIDRILNVVSLSLQNSINNTNWQRHTKILATCAVSCTPYLIMYALGYPALELIATPIVRNVTTYMLPLIYNNIQHINFLREIDLISSTRNFSIYDFTHRNIVHFVKNYFITNILFDTFFVYFVTTAAISCDINLSRDHAGIEVININNIDYVISYSFKDWKFMIGQEIAWTLGKVSVDLGVVLLKSVGIVSDLRNPFVYTQSFASNTAIQELHVSKTSQEARRERREKEHNVKPEIVSKDKEVVQTNITLPRHSDIDRSHAKRKTRSSISSLQSSEARKEEHVIKPFTVSNGEIKVVPLYGSGLGEYRNVWGMIVEDGRKSNNTENFGTSLHAANIGTSRSSSAIKVLDKNKEGNLIFEIRPKSQNNRLLGKLTVGEEAVSAELRRYFSYETAFDITNKMRQGSKNDDISIIIFNNRFKHENVNQALR